MDQKHANEIFKRFYNSNKNPKSELNYSSNFELLIAVMLSAQATDVSVNKATIKLFKIANTPSKIIALGETKLKTFIKSIGLYNTKSKNIIKTCKILVAEYNSKVPSTREELVNLPGVGRKTANVILNVGFKQSTIGVDTHIFRVSNKLGMANAKTPDLTETQLIKVIPKKYLQKSHLWLVLHGRYVCKTQNPKCDECILNDLCKYYTTNTHY